MWNAGDASYDRWKKAYAIHSPVKRWVLIAVLTLPINIGGNVFTVMGNGHAEKSFFSIASMYQVASNDANNALSLFGYQRAGDTAFTLMGIPAWQTGDHVATFIGLPLVQTSKTVSYVLVGGSVIQISNGEAVVSVGFNVSQHANKMVTSLFAVRQQSGTNVRYFGAFWVPLKSTGSEK